MHSHGAQELTQCKSREGDMLVREAGTVLKKMASLLQKLEMIRDCETTIKIKFALFRGVGRGGREENCPKMLFFLGNAMTIKFRDCKLYCREILLSWRRLLDHHEQKPFHTWSLGGGEA